MKIFLLTLSLLLQILITQAQVSGSNKHRRFKLPAGVSSNEYSQNTIIIKLKSGPSIPTTLSTNQFKTLKSGSIQSILKKFPSTRESEIRTKKIGKKDTIGLNRIYELKLNSGGSIESMINELLADPQIEYAEPQYIHHTSYIPNDPRYVSNQQTYLDIIKAPKAWDVVKNAAGIIIAIVDSGSELAHQDLAANISINIADPINGIDDDKDGFLDNFWGWDFVGASGTNIKADNDPNVKVSANDHGVHVSGIAGAVTDNAVGVASISFNCAKLLIVKAGPDDNGSEILKGYDGIKYAADHGARIINCSWGSDGGGNFGQDIINYAVEMGCLVVAAAGNDGNSNPQYPAAYNGVFAIANTQINDVKASSSNYGDYIALAAPGTAITSTVFNNQYAAYTGTSMSSPVVAGAAALVKAARPALNLLQVGELLRVTADNIDAKNPTFVGQLGKGRLNVERALSETPPSVRTQKITDFEVRSTIAQAPDTLYLFFDLKNFF